MFIFFSEHLLVEYLILRKWLLVAFLFEVGILVIEDVDEVSKNRCNFSTGTCFVV